MNQNVLYKVFQLTSLIFVAFITAFLFTRCSDKETLDVAEQYGYVQFRVLKEIPNKVTDTRTALDKLEVLGDAKKVKVVLQHQGVTIEQTLSLKSYDSQSAEFGLRSDKLQLMPGNYEIIGFYLYDKLDEIIYSGLSEDSYFNVVTGGMCVKDLLANAVSTGMATFTLHKEMLPTRATGNDAYPFASISAIDLYVKNIFTREVTAIKEIPVYYKENLRDAIAVCDTTVWLKTGSYQISSYTTYSDKKAKHRLETAKVSSSKTFVIKNNEKTKDVEVPIFLDPTAEYIKDYEALKEIWEALDGPNWRYYGDDVRIGRGQNWNFDKEPDMWGYQPGVFLMGNGRVASVVLTGFGTKGVVPDAVGQLTELQMLILGTHNDLIGGRAFDDIRTPISQDKKKSVRMDYDEKFLNYDVRSSLSQTLIDGINMDNNDFIPIKKDSRIELKDVQVGSFTNQITGISKALMRCTKLEFFYIANSPISDDFFVDISEDSPFYNEQDELSWENLDKLTDMEIYNCPNLKSLPMDMLTQLPELQLLNVASNPNIPGDVLLQNWIDFINGNSGPKIQILYMGNNNLQTIPEYDDLQKMVKLGLLDCSHNKISKVHPFGKEISLVKLYLDYNNITEIPNKDGYFFGYYDTELFSCSHNKLTQIPDVFNAKSKYLMNGVNLSFNEINSFENGDSYKGINAADLNLSNNKFERFPYQLFKSGSPINTLNVSSNGMSTFKKGDMQGKNSSMLVSIDFTFNKLKEIPADDFYPTNVPYLFGVEFSYNQFSNFPIAPLSCNGLTVFSIRHQRDEKGNRILRQWPTGLYKCPSLRSFFIGSNDYRKIDDYISPDISIFDIKDNPNISIDISSVCPYIQAGYYKLLYDPWQNIQGCDALDLE